MTLPKLKTKNQVTFPITQKEIRAIDTLVAKEKSAAKKIKPGKNFLRYSKRLAR